MCFSHTNSIDILVDGNNVGNFPFGSFFPVGTLTPSLSIGGIDPNFEATVLPGVTTEGFKGCVDHFLILGRPVDFSDSDKANQVNSEVSDGCQSALDTFHFDGESFAQYGLYCYMYSVCV